MEPDVGLGVDSGDGMGTTVRANTGGTTGWDETEARVNGNRNPGTPGDDRARSSLRKEKGGEDDGEEEGEEEKEKNQTQWQPSPPPQGPHPPSAVAPDPPASAFALTAASTVPITLSSSPGFALASPQEALKNPATTPPANPREHELNQVRRRFRGVREWREPVAAFSTPPLRGEDHGGGGVCSQDGHDRYDGSGNKATVLSFRLQPSDPDVRTDGEVKRLLGGGRGGGSGGHGQGRGGFGLECVLRVPAGYRGIACGGGDNDGSTTNIKTDADVLPSLQITNAALDRAARQALEDRFLAAVAPISIPAAGPRAREAGGNGRANLRANSNTLLRALNLLDHGLRDVLLTGTGAGAGAGASAGGDEHQPLLLSSQQRPKEAGQRQRRSKQQPTKKQQQQQQQKQRQRNQTEGNARTGAPRNPRRQTSGEGAVRGTPLTTPPFTVNAPDTAHTTMQHTEKPLPLASGPSHPSSPDPRRRQREITQLKARFRLNPLFSASADDTALTVPVTVSPLPSGSPATSLRTVRRVHLLVPPVYPGEPCGVCFDADPAGGGNGGEDRGLEEAAAWTEAGFAAHAEANRAMSLLAQVNFLAARMHGLAVAGRQMKEKEEADKARSGGAGTGEMPDRNVNTATQVSDQRTYAENGASAEAGVQYTDADADADAWAAETGKDGSKDTVADRPHLHIIPRPPEWTVGQDDDSSTDYTNSEASSAELDEDASDDDDDDDDSDRGGVSIPSLPPPLPPPTAGRRVALSFPGMQLDGIELLVLSRLALVVRCERCKTAVDVGGLQIVDRGGAGAAGEREGTAAQPQPSQAPVQAKTQPSRQSRTCEKCGNYMRVEFRHELMHMASNRAAYLGLEGCVAPDLLPSTFTPICAACSTTYPSPGVTAVTGDNGLAWCRRCHTKMKFSLPQAKFLLISEAANAGVAGSTTTGRRKKPKELLGIVAGQELPRRGRCTHYGKSYRWFRFGCCSRVFPCDKCHDAEMDHLNEHANRMICGFCSREQYYRPETCGICHSTLTGKSRSGFWEGGRGTRDRRKMNRKDPRKHKRIGGVKK